MPQADGKNMLQRIALQITGGESDGWYRFQINPAQYKHTYPQRVAVFKTKSHIITEDFGKDIETIQFSGTTGFRKDSSGRTGADRLKGLVKFIDNYAQQGGNGNKAKAELIFHNFTEDESYVVHLAPDSISMERSVDQPLLYTYSLSLVVLRSADTPPERDQVNPNIGNEKPSVGTDQNNSSESKTTKPTTRATGYATSAYENLLSANGTLAVNPSGTVGAYQYGVDELKKLIGYE